MADLDLESDLLFFFDFRWNIDFSNVSVATGFASFTVQRINQLEIALLSCLRFDVRVPASEYAKYYFLIRAMLFRSGQMTEESSQNVPPTAAAESSRRTKSVDMGAEPLLKGVSLEELISQNLGNAAAQKNGGK